MHLILNIGLNTNDGKTLDHRLVLKYLQGFVSVSLNALYQSATEPTLVVMVSPLPHHNIFPLARFARDLRQDCIAVWNVEAQIGSLVGPKPWGEFNPEFFLLFDGQTLASEQKAAA